MSATSSYSTPVSALTAFPVLICSSLLKILSINLMSFFRDSFFICFNKILLSSLKTINLVDGYTCILSDFRRDYYGCTSCLINDKSSISAVLDHVALSLSSALFRGSNKNSDVDPINKKKQRIKYFFFPINSIST